MPIKTAIRMLITLTSTVTTRPSSSGAHPGVIAADSDGQGASFVPTTPFIPGEVVTVSTGLAILGASNGVFTFTTAPTAGVIQPPGGRVVPTTLLRGLTMYRVAISLSVGLAALAAIGFGIGESQAQRFRLPGQENARSGAHAFQVD